MITEDLLSETIEAETDAQMFAIIAKKLVILPEIAKSRNNKDLCIITEMVMTEVLKLVIIVKK
jgi:hypothetical protein